MRNITPPFSLSTSRARSPLATIATMATVLAALLGSLVLPATAGAEPASPCQSSALQSSALAEYSTDCSTTTGGGADNDSGGSTIGEQPLIWGGYPVDGPCAIEVDGVTQVGHYYYDWAIDPATGLYVIGPRYFCLVPRPDWQEVRRQAELSLPTPSITSDYSERLLTNAPVTFSMSTPTTLSKTISLPGYTVVLEAQVKGYLWDFGDPASKENNSTEQHPSHVYTSKSPDPQRPDDHAAHIKLTVIWDGTLRVMANAGDSALPLMNVDALGEKFAVATLDQPIVEVWSAPTESTNV